MSLNEQVAKIMRSHDAFVSEDTIRVYQSLCINHGLNNAEFLEDIFMAIELNGNAQSTDSSKSWLWRPDIMRTVKAEIEKVSVKKPVKNTPVRFENEMANLRIDSGVNSSPQQVTNASQNLLSQSQPLVYGSQSAPVETFGNENIMKNRSQMSKVEIEESHHNIRKIDDFINEPYKVRRNMIVGRMKKMSELFMRHLQKMNIETFTNFSYLDDFISKDYPVFCVGRITTGPTSDVLMENNVYFECYDPATDRAKICLLETKGANQVQYNNGQLVTIPECVFFLNQVMVIEGHYCRETSSIECKNIFTETFVTEDIIAQKRSELEIFDDGKYFSMMVAGGPFMPQSCFDVTPLNEFLNKVLEVRPNIVAILGPFLDQNNEAVKAGELLSGGSNETYLDYNQAFELMINLINDKLKVLPNTSVFIIPSLNDVHNINSYPQPPFYAKDFNKIKFLSNPSQVCLNKNVNISFSSADMLFDVIKNSFVKNNASNKFSLCLKEVLNQRMLYPVYPTLIPLDTRGYENIEMDGIPDIVFYSSALPSGIKLAKSTLFINYGMLVKGKDVGSYVTINVANDMQKLIEERVSIKTSKL